MHLLSADELENVLSVRDLRMFELLRSKRLDAVDERMDWGGYLARNTPIMPRQMLTWIESRKNSLRG